MDLEIKRARFVVNQRCLLRVRLRDSKPCVIRVGIEQVDLESHEAAINAGGVATFAFTPRHAGEFRVSHLSALVDGESYSLADNDLALRVSPSENETSGVVYNIQVKEMYGSDLKIDHRGASSPEEDWQPVRLMPGLSTLSKAQGAAGFRQAFDFWNSPQGYKNVVSIGDTHWAIREQLGKGEISDVYLADRARIPTERVVLKVLRDVTNADRFERAWRIVQKLQASNAIGADTFTKLIPQPVAFDRRAMAFRWASGFRHTLADVQKLHPKGVDPRVGVWIWRRMLEILSFVHRSGVWHGAIRPEHILVENGEHGIRLIGYTGEGSIEADLQQSARAVQSVVGHAPEPFATLLGGVSDGDWDEAWDVREEIGKIALSLFGKPSFNPIRFG